jgi:epsilon-lactone hydrolase
MPRFHYTILSRAKAEQEEEFVSWYAEQHLADVCRMPGVVSGKLFRLGLQKVYDLDAPVWTLMALYELEGDDPQAIIDSIVAVSGTDVMPSSDALTKDGMVQVVGQQIAAIG